LLPGVWRGNPADIAYQYVGTRYRGSLPLIEAGRRLAGTGFAAGQDIMSELVTDLAEAGLIAKNPVTGRILGRLGEIRSVAGMAQIAGLSPRQLQRTLKRTTGFSPHDLLKVLRLQQSFRQHYLDLYADQAHYIHSFRGVTGYTPAKFARKFDV
jgi:AraC-like DNA-binding protein